MLAFLHPDLLVLGEPTSGLDPVSSAALEDKVAAACDAGRTVVVTSHVLIELEPILENRNILGVPIKYGEDRFLTHQIVKHGYKTRMTMDAYCFTKAPRPDPSRH